MHYLHHSAVCSAKLLFHHLWLLYFEFSVHMRGTSFSIANNKIKGPEPVIYQLLFRGLMKFLPPWKLHLSFWKTWPGQSVPYLLLALQVLWGAVWWAQWQPGSSQQRRPVGLSLPLAPLQWVSLHHPLYLLAAELKAGSWGGQLRCLLFWVLVT